METSLIRLKLVLIAAIFGLVSGCSNDDDNITYDLTGSWKVIAFVEGNGQRITKSEENTYMDINNGDITINSETIDDNDEVIFQGIAVTNGCFGNYTVDMSGKITIGTITTTFIGEPEWADLFKITDVERYEVRIPILLSIGTITKAV